MMQHRVQTLTEVKSLSCHVACNCTLVMSAYIADKESAVCLPRPIAGHGEHVVHITSGAQHSLLAGCNGCRTVVQHVANSWDCPGESMISYTHLGALPYPCRFTMRCFLLFVGSTQTSICTFSCHVIMSNGDTTVGTPKQMQPLNPLHRDPHLPLH